MYFITEESKQNWSNMLKEEFNVSDANKLSWVSEVAAIHELHESALGIQGTMGGQTVIPAQGVSPMYATPLNTPGMGNPSAPSPLSPTSTSTANFYNQTAGSGDIPVSTLPMALNIALTTIGLELVPVIPAKGPWAMLTYMDFPYTGGKLGGSNLVPGIDGVGAGRENKPLFVKVLGGTSDVFADIKAVAKAGDEVKVSSSNGTLTGLFKQWGRMDGGLILEVVSCRNAADDKDIAITDVFANGVEVTATVNSKTAKVTKVDYVQTSVDLINGYANFATGSREPMTRAQNETGTGNSIGLRLFSKWVEMGAYEVTGTVTRQQLQDLPLYGVDAISKVLEAMQNELTQHINTVILDNIFALGVTNAVNQKAFQGLDLNLHMGKADKDMAATTIAHYTDVYGVDHKATWGAIKNVEVNTSAENLHTRQRRVATRILAAANTIMVTGRRGKGNICVTNLQIATALQDVSGYVVAPMANTMSQTSGSLYFAGQLGGVNIYVDPYMTWDDTRVCVGRKGNGNEPGLVFMPYILADQVSIVAEGTMSQKLLTNSRFCITPVGFYPDTQYYTFVVDSDFGLV